MRPSDSAKLLLLCSFQGQIVFSAGDTSLLQITHQDLLGKNIFRQGITLKSILTLKHSLCFTHSFHLLSHDRDFKQFALTFVRRKMEGTFRQRSLAGENTDCRQYLRRLNLDVSVLRVSSRSQPIRARIVNVSESQPHFGPHQQLVMLEVTQCTEKPEEVTLQDVEYTYQHMEELDC